MSCCCIYVVHPARMKMPLQHSESRNPRIFFNVHISELIWCAEKQYHLCIACQSINSLIMAFHTGIYRILRQPESKYDRPHFSVHPDRHTTETKFLSISKNAFRHSIICNPSVTHLMPRGTVTCDQGCHLLCVLLTKRMYFLY